MDGYVWISSCESVLNYVVVALTIACREMFVPYLDSCNVIWCVVYSNPHNLTMFPIHIYFTFTQYSCCLIQKPHVGFTDIFSGYKYTEFYCEYNIATLIIPVNMYLLDLKYLLNEKFDFFF
jgi:hypothetical protein